MKIDVLKDAQRGIEIAAEALWHVGDTPTLCDAERFVGHVAVKDLYMALLDNPHARDQCQQSRLANTVRTDHADHPTCGISIVTSLSATVVPYRWETRSTLAM